ncbi:MAG TPA: ribonuclease P protein component [Acidimicrobiales bacterium]|nr:ribonuclease P protein component [Acidimicrobiales bacterium]
MARRWRVRDRGSFAALRREGVRRRVGPLTVTHLADGCEPPRVAYALGRPVGSAVTRNRLRRRLRAVVADTPLAPGTYLVSAGPGAAGLAGEDLRRALLEAVA